jgi:hypothetical protein
LTVRPIAGVEETARHARSYLIEPASKIVSVSTGGPDAASVIPDPRVQLRARP